MEKKFLEIYTDGACSGNPGPGGWGAVLLWDKHIKEISGFEENTTNNRMELLAAIEALKQIKKDVHIKLYTDSQYLKRGMTEWLKLWLHNNWNRGKVKNVDLWKQLAELDNNLKVQWCWVKGHSGNVYNEQADVLARNEIMRRTGYEQNAN